MVFGGRQTPAFRGARVLVRDRAAVLTPIALLLIAAVAWISVIRTGLGAPDMTMSMYMPPTMSDGVAFVVGWAVMMTAMMLPSALPMIRLYGATQRREAAAVPTGVPVALFTIVYLVVWSASGIPVYLGHTALMALPAHPLAYGVAAILIAAGVFQLSPLKEACLRECRSPLGFLLGHWRPGLKGSLALGWSHAMYCLGCCWALMVVLVGAGAMGLPWVLLITSVVAGETLLPRGEWVARAAGGAFLLLGAVVALRPDLVTALRGGHGM